MQVNTATLGAFFGVTGVILGALGAHALESVLSPDHLDSFHTAVRYQMYHAILLVLLFVLQLHKPTRWLSLSGWFVFCGILLFSGSIYLLSTRELTGLTQIGFLGPITPIGGMLLITGWVFLLIHSLSLAIPKK